jgi:hypothetical protein
MREIVRCARYWTKPVIGGVASVLAGMRLCVGHVLLVGVTGGKYYGEI